MAKGTSRLTAGHLRKKGPAKLCDGGGLWLYVTRTHSRRWVYRYRLSGKDYEMGLGGLTEVGMEEARKLAAKCRSLKAKGIDPKLHRSSKASNDVWTFDRCAAAYIKAHTPDWSNAKHVYQWSRSLEMFASPTFGHLPVDQVDADLIVLALEDIWKTKTETATRVRQRIEAVLSWAIVSKHRTGPNPAIWRGNLEMLLAKPSKVREVRHQPAMPYRDVSSFVAELRGKTGISAQALELLILTATRTREVIGASWDEFDLEAGVWVVPSRRMKGRKDHRVPLSTQAVDLLDGLPMREGWLFPSVQHGKHISNMAMLQLMRGMGYGVQGDRGDFVPHGFRSSFRDWCAEQTNYPRELAEAALAHVLKDKTEAAYQRGDLLEKRRRLMQAWAGYCDKVQVSADVVPIGAAK